MPRFFYACTVLACLLLCPAALAQAKKPPAVEITQIDLGWKNRLQADHWCPITVWVTSQTHAFSGILTLEYGQDATQSVQVMVPITTTPGLITPIEIEAAAPFRCQRLTFSITGEDGREKAHVAYAALGSGGDVLPMPAVARSATVLTIGDFNLNAVMEGAAIEDLNENSGPAAPQPPAPVYTPNATPKPGLWSQLDVYKVAPDRLPASWMAYDSADALVVEPDALAKADSRSIAALQVWLESGGRVVVLADAAGDTWKSLFPKAADAVVVDQQQRVKPGERLRSLILGNEPDAELSAKARPIHVTPAGTARGWKLTWDIEGEAGLKATGPYGLGMLAIVGVDPKLLPPLASDKSNRRVWRDALDQFLAPHAQQLRDATSMGYYWERGDEEVHQAISSTLDKLAVVPPLGTGVFVAIGACMFVLTIMVGPFDAVVLKRLRMSQRSWMTALLWIGLASTGAYMAPRMLRSGETAITRATSIDIICDRDGLPQQAAQTGVTGVFGGRPLRVAFEGAPAGAWWSGVSALESFGESSHVFSPLTLPIVTQQDEPPLRGTPAQPFNVPQWTYRGTMDEGPLQAAKATQLGAKVREKDGGWEVTLLNVPRGATVGSAYLRIGDKWHTLTFGKAEGAEPLQDLAATSGTELSATQAPQDWRPGGTRPNEYTAMSVHAPMLSLPGTRERGAAVEALTSGGFACVCVRLDNMPLDLTHAPIKSLQSNRSATVRILTPLENVH